ncbi:hypothetical protein ACB092_02G142300 [Castanea dentata]
MDYPEYPNSNLSNTNLTGNSEPWSLDFELSEYLMLEDHHHHHGVDQDSTSQSMASSEQVMGGSSGSTGATLRNNNIRCKDGVKKNKMEAGHRVAFRTKSELEVMDDGFKWRKYGKKSVKNSPNPREHHTEEAKRLV